MYISKTNYYCFQCNKINEQKKYSLNNFTSTSFIIQNQDVFFGNKNNYLNNLLNKIELGKLENGYLTNAYKKKKLNKNDILQIAMEFPDKISQDDFVFFAKNKIPLTEFDDEDILKRRKKGITVKPLTRWDKGFIAQKSKILKHEFSLLDKASKEKKMTIVVGLGGSGKSTFAEANYSNTHYIADVDEIRKLFSEYKNGEGSQKLYKISTELLQQDIFPHAINQGSNIVLQTTRFTDYIKELATPAKAKGYHVELIFVDTDKKIAMTRAIKRFKETNRFLDPYLIASRAPYTHSTIEKLKNSDSIDTIKIINCSETYSNISPKFLVERFKQNTIVYK